MTTQRVPLALIILVFVPSAQLALKFLGWSLTAVYLAALAVAIGAVFAIERNDRHAEVVQRNERYLMVAWILAMAAALAVIYPLAQSHVFGPGSDRVDALMVGIQALLDGHYPYYERTYFGGRLSPMPGALLLGMPFHLLGSVAIQNFVYGVACVLLVACGLRTWRTRWLLLSLFTFGNVAFLQDYVTGGDYVLTGLYVGVAVYLSARALEREEMRVGETVATGMFLGLSLCSRPIYVVAGVALVAYAFRRHGPRRAAVFAAVVFGTAAMLILPFFLYDPAEFMPSHLLRLVPPSLRWLNTALPAAAVLLALLPAFRDMDVWGLIAVVAASLFIILVPGAVVRIMFGNHGLHYLVPPALCAAMVLLARDGRLLQQR